MRKKYTIVADLKEIKYYFAKDVIDFLKNSKNKNIDIYINDECVFMLDKNTIMFYNDTVKIPKCLYSFIMKNFLKGKDFTIKTLDFFK